MSFVSRYLDHTTVERLNHLQLSARRVVEGATTGQHRSPLKGASVDFRQHRFYTAGDEPRRLDWRVLARTDRPYIKEYDEETNLRSVLLLDASGSMAYGSGSAQKFEFAARIAAALAYLMLGQTESVGLAIFRESLDHWIGPASIGGQLSRIVEILERSSTTGKASLSAAVQDVSSRLDRRALVILLSDLFCPIAQFRESLARLRYRRHETIVLRVLHADEVKFPFKSWSQFRGLEGEKAIHLEPAMMRAQYLQRFESHSKELEHSCRALGAEYHSFSTDVPMIESLTTFLRRREAV